MSRRVITQLIFAAFWFTSAYAAMTALLSNEWAWRCAWFNLIIGLVSLLLITRSELGELLSVGISIHRWWPGYVYPGRAIK
jgi:hypothetical protein